MIFNNRSLFFFCLKVYTHTFGISFRMKLSAYHMIIKTDAHNRSFVRHMRSFFFNAKNRSIHCIYFFFVRFYYLPVAAVYYIKRIGQTFKNNFFLPFISRMYWEYTEGSGFSFCNLTYIKMPANNFIRMTNKKNKFLVADGIIVPVFNTSVPGEINFFPIRTFAFQRASRTTAG